MSRVSSSIAELSPEQRALLELRLQQRRLRAASAPAPAPAAGAEGDEENLVLADSVESVEELLSKFYGRFPWPWPARKFTALEDAEFERVMLNQDVGDWSHRTVPEGAAVWVAGSGTNQGIHTALRFPNARVVASDISAKSLEICEQNARRLGVSNLELRQESINQVGYEEEFDFVVCTGVIHHNAEPGVTLERLSAALRPTGVMEMMVYNRYHRTVTSAFQKTVRIFGAAEGGLDFESELALARKLAANMPVKDTLEKAFIQYMDWSESDFADLLIQPVEHSYTVESLEELAHACGLEMALPCVSQYAKHLSSTFLWNLEFADAELQARYDALPDSRRWQVTNLMLQDKSPLLWFYLRRRDCPAPRKAEAQVCEEFLDTAFERAPTRQSSYIRNAEGGYDLSPRTVPYPQAPPDGSLKEIHAAADGRRTMREIFAALGLGLDFRGVNRARVKLATSAFPYLRAARA